MDAEWTGEERPRLLFDWAVFVVRALSEEFVYCSYFSEKAGWPTGGGAFRPPEGSKASGFKTFTARTDISTCRSKHTSDLLLMPLAAHPFIKNE